MKSDQFVSQAAQYSVALVLLAVLAGYVAVRECYAHHDLDIARLYFASWYVNTLSPSPFAGPGQGGGSATAVRTDSGHTFSSREEILDVGLVGVSLAGDGRAVVRVDRPARRWAPLVEYHLHTTTVDRNIDNQLMVLQDSVADEWRLLQENINRESAVRDLASLKVDYVGLAALERTEPVGQVNRIIPAGGSLVLITWPSEAGGTPRLNANEPAVVIDTAFVRRNVARAYRRLRLLGRYGSHHSILGDMRRFFSSCDWERTIVPDPRGTGGSSMGDNFSFADAAPRVSSHDESFPPVLSGDGFLEGAMPRRTLPTGNDSAAARSAVRIAFLRHIQERWARLDADYWADTYASGIRRMARYNGLEPSGDTSTPARFAALQKSLITQPIPVPFVQLTVPALAAESIMCLIALILTVSVRACIWAILKDPAHGIDQPWLMLDTPTRAGGALAWVWTVMTAFALPICVVACATVFTLQVAAQEIELWTPLPIAAMIVMLGTGVYGFINAAGTVVAVRRLRSKRRQAATSTKPPASNDAPLGGSE